MINTVGTCNIACIVVSTKSVCHRSAPQSFFNTNAIRGDVVLDWQVKLPSVAFPQIPSTPVV
jgi:hypothetical protein